MTEQALKTEPRIAIVCAVCNSTNVMRDAWAVWSEQEQEWELGTVFDQGYCENCGCESSLEEQEIE